MAAIDHMFKLYTVIIILNFVVGCSNRADREEIYANNNGKKACIQILRGEGDWGLNVVSFYYSEKADHWVWCYIDHEIGERKWEIEFDSSGKYVLIIENNNVIGGYDAINDIFILRDVFKGSARKVAVAPEHQGAATQFDVSQNLQMSKQKTRPRMRDVELLQEIIKKGRAD